MLEDDRETARQRTQVAKATTIISESLGQRHELLFPLRGRLHGLLISHEDPSPLLSSHRKSQCAL